MSKLFSKSSKPKISEVNVASSSVAHTSDVVKLFQAFDTEVCAVLAKAANFAKIEWDKASNDQVQEKQNARKKFDLFWQHSDVAGCVTLLQGRKVFGLDSHEKISVSARAIEAELSKFELPQLERDRMAASLSVENLSIAARKTDNKPEGFGPVAKALLFGLPVFSLGFFLSKVLNSEPFFWAGVVGGIAFFCMPFVGTNSSFDLISLQNKNLVAALTDLLAYDTAIFRKRERQADLTLATTHQRVTQIWAQVVESASLRTITLNQAASEAMRRAEQIIRDPKIQPETPGFPKELMLGTVALRAQVSSPAIAAMEFDGKTSAGAVPLTGLKLDLPLVLPLLQAESILLEHNTAAGRKQSAVLAELITATVLHLTPPSRARLILFDPMNLGGSLAPFVSLRDYDPRLIDQQAWTSPSQIERALERLVNHLSDVTQDKLRSAPTFEDYNDAVSAPEPYRLLVALDIPEGLTEGGARSLSQVMEQGERCGVYACLTVDTSKRFPGNVALAGMEASATVLAEIDGVWHVPAWPKPQYAAMEVIPAHSMAREWIDAIVKRVGAAAVNVDDSVVAFSRMLTKFADQRIDKAENRNSSTHGLVIPIGESGTRVQAISLNNESPHAILIGQTGSGKSNLLHVLITAAAELYAPDELEFYLMDFKDGTELKSYAAAGLPHARTVGLKTDPKYGVEVLERIQVEMDRRATLFKSSGIANDIISYRGQTDQKLPRIVVLFDEFHELLRSGRPEASKASELIDRIARQGRGFGVHIVLASQTLKGAVLQAGTLPSMGVRIGLMQAEEDARTLFGEGAIAVKNLQRAGAAIFNNASGNPSANRQFQVAKFDDVDRSSFLAAICQRHKAWPRRPEIYDSEQHKASEAGINIDMVLNKMARFSKMRRELIKLDEANVAEINRLDAERKLQIDAERAEQAKLDKLTSDALSKLDATKVREAVFAGFDLTTLVAAHPNNTSTAAGLEIPLGVSETGKHIAVRFNDDTVHGLVAGMTGQGKSNLLHALILSAATKYSPNELSLYLLDFKDGVEFKVYDGTLAHATHIALEASQEAGLAILDDLLAEAKRRNALFSKEGTNKISEYRSKFGHAMPRILVVLDEFQKLTAGAGWSTEASTRLALLLKEGRSVGIHLLLCTQSLASTQMSESAYNQISLRIALKSAVNDSERTLGIGNKAASTIEKGFAVINHDSGRLAANEIAKIPLASRDVQDQYLNSIKKQYPNVLMQIVLDGKRDALLKNCKPLLMALKKLGQSPAKATAWVGEPPAFGAPVKFELPTRASRNVLIVDRDEGRAAGILLAILTSLCAQTNAANLSVTLMDSLDPEFSEMIPKLLGMRLSCVDPKQPTEALAQMQRFAALIVERQSHRQQYRTEIIVLSSAMRWRELRDDPNMLIRDKAGLVPTLVTILRDGPDVGVHVIANFDTKANFERAFPSNVRAEFGVRLVGPMSESDSNLLIGSNLASKITDEDNRMLLSDSDLGNRPLTLRPYKLVSANELPIFARLFVEREASAT